LEKQPLLKQLGKGLADTWGAVDDSGPVMKGKQGDSGWDSSGYNMASVNSYKILFVMTGAAFDNISILKCMVGSMLISIGVAMLACYQEHALFIEMDRVHTLGTFLNVFVGMLLGFFVSSAMNRWYGCCQGFMDLLEAIRCLQMQMFALGVDIDLINKLNRYGTLSAWLLHFSLNSECKKNPREERVDMTEEEQKEALWSTLESIRPNLALPHEKEMLYRFLDCYGLLWTWILLDWADGSRWPHPTYGLPDIWKDNQHCGECLWQHPGRTRLAPNQSSIHLCAHNGGFGALQYHAQFYQLWHDPGHDSEGWKCRGREPVSVKTAYAGDERLHAVLHQHGGSLLVLVPA